MLKSILVLMVALITSVAAHADHIKHPIVTTPEHALFLYERTLEAGTAVISIYNDRPSTRFIKTFHSRHLPHSCLDVKIETDKDAPSPDFRMFVFDSHCKLPFTFKGERFYIWSNVRAVILVENGELGLAGGTWIEQVLENSYRSTHTDDGGLEQVLRENIERIVQEEKKHLAFMEELAKKGRAR